VLLSHAIGLTGLVSVSHSLVSVLALVSLCSGLKPGSTMAIDVTLETPLHHCASGDWRREKDVAGRGHLMNHALLKSAVCRRLYLAHSASTLRAVSARRPRRNSTAGELRDEGHTPNVSCTLM